MKFKMLTFGATRYVVVVLSVLGAALGVAVASAGAQASPPGATSGDLFVANQAANTIEEFSANGDDLGVFASSGLNGPTGLAFDKRGNLYVSNINANTIREYLRPARTLVTSPALG